MATQAAEDLLHARLPDSAEIDEDWVLSELDSLSDALANACTRPVEAEPKLAAVTTNSQPRGTAAIVRPLAAPPAAPVRPASAAPNLLDRLTGIVALCRPARRPLSLLLVRLSAGDELLSSCKPHEWAAIRQALNRVCSKLDHPGAIGIPHTETGFAMILPGAERSQAVELGNDMLRAMRGVAVTAGIQEKEWLKLDVGVASIAQAPKNFPPRDLLDGAERCLYASHASGGGVVKSIEIY